jgi:hypothetical protein
MIGIGIGIPLWEIIGQPQGEPPGASPVGDSLLLEGGPGYVSLEDGPGTEFILLE